MTFFVNFLKRRVKLEAFPNVIGPTGSLTLGLLAFQLKLTIIPSREQNQMDV